MPESIATGWKQVIAVVGALAALMVVLLSAFALPPLNSGPHDVPLAISGQPSENDALRERLEAQQPGAYKITSVDDEERARELILDRKVYGAIVLSEPETTMLIASAASPAIATNLRTLAGSLGEAQSTAAQNTATQSTAARSTAAQSTAAQSTDPQGTAVQVEDVRPLPDDDPNGAGLAAGALPLALGGWIAAVVLLMTIRGPRHQATGAVGFAVVGGLALTALLQFGFGTLDGNYWLTAAAAALGISATAWTILGLRTALGNAGLGLGAVTLILLGNPLSGLASAPEMLPAGWGTLGQFLPPGATGTLLRSVAYFDGAAATRPALVLAWWMAGGLLLYAVGTRRARRHDTGAPASPVQPEPEPQPLRAG